MLLQFTARLSACAIRFKVLVGQAREKDKQGCFELKFQLIIPYTTMVLETVTQADELQSLRMLLDPKQVLPPDVNEEDLLRVWYYLKYPNEITQDMSWPFAKIALLAPYISPNTSALKPRIPPPLVSFLTVDLRTYSMDRRVRHASFCISSELPFHSFWMSVLHGLLVKFTRCKTLSSENKVAPTKAMYHLIECNVRGTDLESLEVSKGSAYR